MAVGRVYSDYTRDILEGLRKNPLVTVRVLLLRLREKVEEWREGKAELCFVLKQLPEYGGEEVWGGGPGRGGSGE